MKTIQTVQKNAGCRERGREREKESYFSSISVVHCIITVSYLEKPYAIAFHEYHELFESLVTTT